ncbi:MAG TPA: polyhydroxyalkanoate depolymerase [Dokdonella sp.]|uniref:polyhydroxyalkanoate depolymerase n=1 Tax=Dokdonella sp. TaxID=2291710 RepID=UPI002D80D8A1|nr:polyhydroxyalkanoate depolymerase [Dokdonella sp.]HET9034361.1 polyhydroxyalkanoate depolymerase [Dokdonella sp.]
MLYNLHELNRSLMNPLVGWSGAAAQVLTAKENWLSHFPGVQRLAAGYELAYRLGKDYEKPAFAIPSVTAHGYETPISERVSIAKPFCNLIRFKRFSDDVANLDTMKHDPIVLVVAPLSGHHSTLLRDTVKSLLQDHKVYLTDWIDARMVPLDQGEFDLDDYIAYIQEFIRHIGAERLHVISVCQPTVPVMAAISLMASKGEKTPLTMTMMGGPIDPRRCPTKVNNLATTRPLSWFESNVIHTVPSNYPGKGRKVYPGFLQHAGFVAMNPSRHMSSHWDFYENLRRGDLEDAKSHRKFYDDYNAVLDMPAPFYLDTISTVFQKHLLPRGLWDVQGERVKPGDIRDTALLTIEGEHDDISGRGQTEAAHEMCSGIPTSRKQNLLIEGAGHYGIFSGRRWRETIYPQLRDFIAQYAKPTKNASRRPVAKRPRKSA